VEDIRLELGRVVAALPYHNNYVIRFLGRAGTSTAIAMDDSGDARGGVSAGPTYLPGTSVIVAVFDETSTFYKYYSVSYVILGAFGLFPLHRTPDNNFVPRDITLDSPSGYNDNQAYRRILENEYIPILNQDRSYNRALDSVPGDWYRSTPMGGVILLSDFLTRIGASERSYLEFNSITNELVGQLDAKDIDGEVTRDRWLNYGDTLLRVSSDAYSRGECLGAVTGVAPFFRPEVVEGEDVDARVEPRTDIQRGFFRMEELSGGGVEGFMRAIKTDYGSGIVFVHEDGNVTYPGVVREDSRMDGKYRVQAAKEIRFDKHFYIPVPYEIADEGELEEVIIPETDDDRAVLENILQGEDAYAALQHLIADNISELDEEAQRVALQQRSSVWKTPSREELEEAVGAESEDLEPLGDDDVSYSIDDLLSVVAELYPGRRIRIYKNHSMFLMADDGGVTIGDGFGAEIRMSRGNVTIAAAGDITMQPGRDLVEWVPRNRISKVRQRVEIVSSNDSISIKSEKNLQMLSGNGGTGSTVIENRANNTDLSQIAVSALEQGRAIGSGVHIRSTLSGVSILGDYIYGGGYTNQTDEAEGLTPVSCNILLDAGPGFATLKGNAAAVLGTVSASISMEGTSSGLYIVPNIASLIGTSQITQTAQAVFIQGGGGEFIDKPFVNKDGVQTRRVSVPRIASPTLAAAGQIVCGAGLSVRGDMQVTGAGVANGGFGIPQQKVSISVPEGVVGIAPAVAGNGVGNLLSYMTATAGVQTARGQSILGIAFPNSDSEAYHAKNFEIVETKWQQRLNTSRVWIESKVSHTILDNGSYPYPGADNYSNEKVIKSVSVEDGVITPTEKILSEYKINTET
jgi:hypothetical protein